MHSRLIFTRFSMTTKNSLYEVKKVNKPHAIQVEVPGSKSITNRALLLAALSEGQSRLSGVLFSDDSRHFLDSLKRLGFPVKVSEEEKTVMIQGFGGQIPCVERVKEGEIAASIDVGSAGTAARFLTAFLGLSQGRFRIDASEQMKKRPMKELLLALEELGAEIFYEETEYHFPFVIGQKSDCRGFAKCEVSVDVDKSSQFLSALLISSVLSEQDFTIHVKGTHGMAYVDMTVQMMEQFGVHVEMPEEKHYCISKDAAYQLQDYRIEPDLSAACYFYAMSPVLHVPAKVFHVHRKCLQGDIRFLSVLEDMGCSIEEEKNGVTVFPPKGRFLGGAWDLSAYSDQALTLAAIAPYASGEVFIQNISHIRYQECDRIQAILSNLNAMGISCSEENGTIAITPGTPHACEIETYEDHRVAMAFAIPGLVTEGIQIRNPMCCAKTFEDYFEVLEHLY